MGRKRVASWISQHLLDGILVGSILSLGAIGLTLRCTHAAIRQFFPCGIKALSRCLRSTGFHKSFGPLYLKSAVLSILSVLPGVLSPAILFAMIVTGLSAILIDKLVFRRIREKGGGAIDGLQLLWDRDGSQ